MPRKPFLPFYKKNIGGRLEVGSGVLGHRPQLEALIAHCLMSWPPAEAEMAVVLGQLLGASESEAALAVFQSLRRSSAQRDAISEAARVTLVETQDRQLLAAILAVYKSVEDERNALTHGHFGTYSLLEDGIIWMPTKAYVDFVARMQLANQVFTDAIKEKLYSEIYYYKADDLIKIMIDIQDMADIWFSFRLYLRSHPPQRAELYHRLCDRPRIRQELDLLSRKTNSPAPRE